MHVAWFKALAAGRWQDSYNRVMEVRIRMWQSIFSPDPVDVKTRVWNRITPFNISLTKQKQKRGIYIRFGSWRVRRHQSCSVHIMTAIIDMISRALLAGSAVLSCRLDHLTRSEPPICCIIINRNVCGIRFTQLIKWCSFF